MLSKTWTVSTCTVHIAQVRAATDHMQSMQHEIFNADKHGAVQMSCVDVQCKCAMQKGNAAWRCSLWRALLDDYRGQQGHHQGS